MKVSLFFHLISSRDLLDCVSLMKEDFLEFPFLLGVGSHCIFSSPQNMKVYRHLENLKVLLFPN